MNAYELAKYIEDDIQIQEGIADMLRQQADRIAELEKLLEHSVGSDCREMRYIQEIENKDARIAELEKKLQESAMNYISICSQADEHYARVKELEKQTKPLSDADIQQISHRYHYTYNPDYVGFARAIEKAHGIK